MRYSWVGMALVFTVMLAGCGEQDFSCSSSATRTKIRKGLDSYTPICAGASDGGCYWRFDKFEIGSEQPYKDTLLCRTTVVDGRGISTSFDYQVLKGEDGKIYVRMSNPFY